MRLAAQATEHLGAGAESGPGRGSCQNALSYMQLWFQVYGPNTLPADLEDAVARYVSDRDIYEQEPSLELLSIMLKYGPVRRELAQAWRSRRAGRRRGVPKVSEASEVSRIRKLHSCLVDAIRKAACRHNAQECSLWSKHWGKHVGHHSGWLPFLQRPTPVL